MRCLWFVLVSPPPKQNLELQTDYYLIFPNSPTLPPQEQISGYGPEYASIISILE